MTPFQIARQAKILSHKIVKAQQDLENGTIDKVRFNQIRVVGACVQRTINMAIAKNRIAQEHLNWADAHPVNNW